MRKIIFSFILLAVSLSFLQCKPRRGSTLSGTLSFAIDGDSAQKLLSIASYIEAEAMGPLRESTYLSPDDAPLEYRSHDSLVNLSTQKMDAFRVFTRDQQVSQAVASVGDASFQLITRYSAQIAATANLPQVKEDLEGISKLAAPGRLRLVTLYWMMTAFAQNKMLREARTISYLYVQMIGVLKEMKIFNIQDRVDTIAQRLFADYFINGVDQLSPADLVFYLQQVNRLAAFAPRAVIRSITGQENLQIRSESFDVRGIIDESVAKNHLFGKTIWSIKDEAFRSFVAFHLGASSHLTAFEMSLPDVNYPAIPRFSAESVERIQQNFQILQDFYDQGISEQLDETYLENLLIENAAPTQIQNVFILNMCRDKGQIEYYLAQYNESLRWLSPEQAKVSPNFTVDEIVRECDKLEDNQPNTDFKTLKSYALFKNVMKHAAGVITNSLTEAHKRLLMANLYLTRANQVEISGWIKSIFTGLTPADQADTEKLNAYNEKMKLAFETFKRYYKYEVFLPTAEEFGEAFKDLAETLPDRKNMSVRSESFDPKERERMREYNALIHGVVDGLIKAKKQDRLGSLGTMPLKQYRESLTHFAKNAATNPLVFSQDFLPGHLGSILPTAQELTPSAADEVGKKAYSCMNQAEIDFLLYEKNAQGYEIPRISANEKWLMANVGVVFGSVDRVIQLVSSAKDRFAKANGIYSKIEKEAKGFSKPGESHWYGHSWGGFSGWYGFQFLDLAESSLSVFEQLDWSSPEEARFAMKYLIPVSPSAITQSTDKLITNPDQISMLRKILMKSFRDPSESKDRMQIASRAVEDAGKGVLQETALLMCYSYHAMKQKEGNSEFARLAGSYRLCPTSTNFYSMEDLCQTNTLSNLPFAVLKKLSAVEQNAANEQVRILQWQTATEIPFLFIAGGLGGKTIQIAGRAISNVLGKLPGLAKVRSAVSGATSIMTTQVGRMASGVATNIGMTAANAALFTVYHRLLHTGMMMAVRDEVNQDEVWRGLYDPSKDWYQNFGEEITMGFMLFGVQPLAGKVFDRFSAQFFGIGSTGQMYFVKGRVAGEGKISRFVKDLFREPEVEYFRRLGFIATTGIGDTFFFQAFPKVSEEAYHLVTGKNSHTHEQMKDAPEDDQAVAKSAVTAFAFRMHGNYGGHYGNPVVYATKSRRAYSEYLHSREVLSIMAKRGLYTPVVLAQLDFNAAQKLKKVVRQEAIAGFGNPKAAKTLSDIELDGMIERRIQQIRLEFSKDSEAPSQK